MMVLGRSMFLWLMILRVRSGRRFVLGCSLVCSNKSSRSSRPSRDVVATGTPRHSVAAGLSGARWP